MANRIVHWHMSVDKSRFACVVPDESIKIVIDKNGGQYTAWHEKTLIPGSAQVKLKDTKAVAEKYVEGLPE